MKLEKVVSSCSSGIYTSANSIKVFYNYIMAYLFHSDGILLCGVTNISVDYPLFVVARDRRVGIGGSVVYQDDGSY